jgi:hypothetical protein
MLPNEAFEQWCRRLRPSGQAAAIIATIRASEPSRAVRAAAGNAPTRFVSIGAICYGGTPPQTHLMGRPRSQVAPPGEREHTGTYLEDRHLHLISVL